MVCKNAVLLDELWRFDGKWTRIFHGTTQQQQEQGTAEVTTYATGTWPTARDGHAMAAVGTNVFLLGGFASEAPVCESGTCATPTTPATNGMRSC